MSAFNKSHPLPNNLKTRKYGGTSAKIAADPYISGYHFVWFRNLPKALTKSKQTTGLDVFKKLFKGEDLDSEYKQKLSGACQGVTVPGATLNRAEISSLGGTKWTVPTSIDYGNTITIKFLEFSGLLIHKFINNWVSLIRDYKTGASNLEGSYTKTAYTGSMYYWTTRPNGRFKDRSDIEYAALYTGMYPLKVPHDSFSSDIASVDKVEIDIDFNIDWIYHENWVKKEITDLYSDYFSKTFGKAKRNPEYPTLKQKEEEEEDR